MLERFDISYQKDEVFHLSGQRAVQYSRINADWPDFVLKNGKTIAGKAMLISYMNS
jgi:hypothetical protein